MTSARLTVGRHIKESGSQRRTRTHTQDEDDVGPRQHPEGREDVGQGKTGPAVPSHQDSNNYNYLNNNNRIHNDNKGKYLVIMSSFIELS